MGRYRQVRDENNVALCLRIRSWVLHRRIEHVMLRSKKKLKKGDLEQLPYLSKKKKKEFKRDIYLEKSQKRVEDAHDDRQLPL